MTVGIMSDYPLITANTNLKSGLIKVVCIANLNIVTILVTNEIILLKLSTNILRLVSILKVNINGTLLANIVLRMPTKKLASQLLSNSWYCR